MAEILVFTTVGDESIATIDTSGNTAISVAFTDNIDLKGKFFVEESISGNDWQVIRESDKVATFFMTTVLGVVGGTKLRVRSVLPLSAIKEALYVSD